MRSWLLRGVLVVAAFGLATVLLLPDAPAQVQIPDRVYLSLEPGTPLAPGVLDLSQGPLIPANCATWHELYPTFCNNRHQDAYEDNGDGEVSACDAIVLDGETWHVEWVGPTYYMTCYPPSGDPTDVVGEPNQEPHDPGSPVCETWEEVYPNFGTLFHVDDWADNDGSGTITPCDDIFSGGNRYHIDDIALNIIVEPPSTPVERSTWGRIKSWLPGIGR